MNRVLALILCVSFLAACGGSKEEQREPIAVSRLKAAELSEKAAEAYKKGSYELALNYYREALRLSRSVEDFRSMAVGAVNTASALRATGQLDAADGLMDELLQARYMDLPRGLEAEARYMKALILMDRDDTDGTVEQTDLALEACRKSCNALTRIYNLSARAHMAAGDISAAREQAQKGLKSSHRAEDVREEANALRLLAAMDEAEGKYQDAAKRFEHTLEMDKKLALGPKIYHDLMGIGRMAVNLGNPSKAEKYFSRALSVAEALGDKDKAGQARDVLAIIQKSQ